MIKTEQLYELNLPSFEKIILPTFKGFEDDCITSNYNFLVVENITEIIKPEYLSIANLNWKRIFYFKKSNYTGSIHSDASLPNQTYFSINWITDGNGLIEFWDETDVITLGSTPGSINEPTTGIRPTYLSKSSPSKLYPMYKDHVYLINASTPHRARGFKNRKCYSMRTDHTDIAWDTVVKLFNKYIIK